jgi:hypothetical protein
MIRPLVGVAIAPYLTIPDVRIEPSNAPQDSAEPGDPGGLRRAEADVVGQGALEVLLNLP